MISVAPSLLQPERLWKRSGVLVRACPVPKAPGIYAWYFDAITGVPDENANEAHGWKLLYVGISPKHQVSGSPKLSKQTLQSRVRYHLAGNAEGSTLRLTLGCLLAHELGLELRRVGSGTRLTFHAGEQALNAWLEDHARIC